MGPEDIEDVFADEVEETIEYSPLKIVDPEDEE